jgi:maltose alpha-D-glucosyltransferase/alpha-amylase
VDRYLLPLSFLADDAANAALPQQLALTRLRRGRRVGFLTDAFALDALPRLLLQLLRENKALPSSDGELRFESTEAMRAMDVPADIEVRRMAAEQSNSSVVLGEKMILKLIRRPAGGVHPEAEMGRVLTARGYANVAPLLGEVTRVAADGTPFLLCLVQGFMHNQGDAWTWTQNILERAIHDVPIQPEAPPAEGARRDALTDIRRAGQRRSGIRSGARHGAGLCGRGCHRDCAHRGGIGGARRSARMGLPYRCRSGGMAAGAAQTPAGGGRSAGLPSRRLFAHAHPR